MRGRVPQYTGSELLQTQKRFRREATGEAWLSPCSRKRLERPSASQSKADAKALQKSAYCDSDDESPPPEPEPMAHEGGAQGSASLHRTSLLHHAVILGFYNIGINNKEVEAQTSNWIRKLERLGDDIKTAFCPEGGKGGAHRVQVLFLSEFGNMHRSINDVFRELRGGGSHHASDTKEFFQRLLKRLGLDDIVVHAHAPYVALVDSSSWDVDVASTLHDVCTTSVHGRNFVQHLLLRHVESNCKVRVFNVHIPTSSGSGKRKEDTIKYLCRLAVSGQGDAPHWVIRGRHQSLQIHVYKTHV